MKAKQNKKTKPGKRNEKKNHRVGPFSTQVATNFLQVRNFQRIGQLYNSPVYKLMEFILALEKKKGKKLKRKIKKENWKSH